MIYARMSPELMLDMEPIVARVRSATCMVRVAKNLREQAELAEIIAVDHMRDAHDAMVAEIQKLYPDLVGQPYYFNAETGDITLPDNTQENTNEPASRR